MPSLLCQSLAFLKVVNRTRVYSCIVRARPSVSIFQVKLIPELALIQNCLKLAYFILFSTWWFVEMLRFLGSSQNSCWAEARGQWTDWFPSRGRVDSLTQTWVLRFLETCLFLLTFRKSTPCSRSFHDLFRKCSQPHDATYHSTRSMYSSNNRKWNIV